MVIPRSRSRSIESSTCGRCFRSTAPVSSRKRSASVDLPWSMWAMIEKLRMLSMGVRKYGDTLRGSGLPAPQEAPDLLGLRDPKRHDRGCVDGGAQREAGRQRDRLTGEAAAQSLVEKVPDRIAAPREGAPRRGHASGGPQQPPQLQPAKLLPQDHGLRQHA